MAQQQATVLAGFRNAGDAPIEGRIACIAIVISAYEEDLKIGMALTPAYKRGADSGSHPTLGMKQIPEHDEPSCLRLFEHATQSAEIALPDACRDGNPMVAKRGVLAEMQIGKVDGAPLVLPDCALRQQRQMLSIPLEWRCDRIISPGRTSQEASCVRESNSSVVSSISAAPVFSSRCATEEVPGIGSITGERFSSHASANCATEA